jgi:hypothetical protein
MPVRRDMPDTVRRASAKTRLTWAKRHDRAREQQGEGRRAFRTAFDAPKDSFEERGDRGVREELARAIARRR